MNKGHVTRKKAWFLQGIGWLFLSLSLLGCESSFGPNGIVVPKMVGSVHGGQQPVSNSSIQLYAIGYPSASGPATPLLDQPVLTDSAGEFTIQSFTCPSSTTAVYLTALGGNPGLPVGSNNPNLAEMAFLGSCQDVQALPNVAVNELTTIAAVYSLSPYMASYANVSFSTNAAAHVTDVIHLASELADVTKGQAPGPALPSGQILPMDKLNTLADIVANCVKTTGGVAGDSSACGSLFSRATPSGQAAPTNTIAALLNIAKQPTYNVLSIYNCIGPIVPFQPNLKQAPQDWTIAPESQIDAPTFSPAPGSYNSSQQITLADTNSVAAIYYTTDNTVPTTTSSRYTGPISVSATTTVRAIAAVDDQSSLTSVGSYDLAAPHLVFLTNAVSGNIGIPLSPVTTVAAEDGNGTILTNMTGVVTIQMNSPSNNTVLSGSTTVSLVNGIARFSDLSITQAGTDYVLTASAAGMSAGVSQAIAINPPVSIGPNGISVPKMAGSVYGGQQAVSNSSIQLYAIGYPSASGPATPLLDQPVLTDSAGEFTIQSFTCPSSTTAVYLTALGGNPGLPVGSNNPNLAEMAFLGSCQDVQALPNVAVNELTTIAAVYSLSPYMASYANVSFSTNAAAHVTDVIHLASELADVTKGQAPGPALPSGQILPMDKLNTLADIVANCVKTTGGVAGDSSACGSLFSRATPSGQAAPTNTIAALLNIAKQPTYNVLSIYNCIGPIVPFQPNLKQAPQDWTIAPESQIDAPTFSPAPGSYNSSQQITLADTNSVAAIYYTTDNTVPTTTSSRYTGPISVSATTTVRAIAAVDDQSSLTSVGSYDLAAPHLVFLTNAVSGNIGIPLSPVTTVAAEDGNGTILTNMTGVVTIQMNSPSNNTVLSGSTTVSLVNGIARFSDLSITQAGTDYVLTASAAGMSAGVSQAIAINPPVSISMTPAKTSLAPLQSLQFQAQIANTSNHDVIWSISPAAGTITPSGNYSAPSEIPAEALVTITATSVADPTQSASTQLSLAPAQISTYQLVWEDTFATQDTCVTATPGCNWYNPGLWYAGPEGTITNPSGAYLDLQWTSGQSNDSTSVSTSLQGESSSRAWTFGYFEVNMAFNPVTGSWPGLWMASPLDGPSNSTNGVNYPELDIFEWQSNSPGIDFGTVHVWNDSAFVASEGISPSVSVDFSQFNTYGVLWTPTTVTWYLNGAKLGSVDISQPPYNSVFAGQQPLFLLLSQQDGCNWSFGHCQGQASTLDMKVRWVHVYQATH